MDLLDKLKTRVRLHNIRIYDSTLCGICGFEDESIPHLFLWLSLQHCVQVWNPLLDGLHSRWKDLHILNWIRKYGKNQFRKMVAYCAMVSLGYHIYMVNKEFCCLEECCPFPVFNYSSGSVWSKGIESGASWVRSKLSEIDRQWFNEL